MRKVALFALFLSTVSVAALAETPLERGAYLVNGIVACGNCHTPQTPQGPQPGMELAGGTPMNEPGAFLAYASNITPDRETGIGGWSKKDLIRAIREGIRPDGSLIGPPMPFELYRGLSDRDVDAIATYVMSVPPVANRVPASEYAIPLPPSYGPPVTTVGDPARQDAVAYGAYLAGPLGHCTECHTPMIDGRRDFAHQLGAGGAAFHGPWGISVSQNLTSHPNDGIADYTDAQLAKVIRTGIRPDGSRLMPPMGVFYYRTIDDRDMAALIAYLRSLAPLPAP